LVLWRRSPTTPFPTDPLESLKFAEKGWTVIDDLIKKGEFMFAHDFLFPTAHTTSKFL